MSVTIPPAGECLHRAKRIIDVLARRLERPGFPPHLTLQAIFNPLPETKVIDAVQRVARQTTAFEIQIDGLDILPAPFDPAIKYVYLTVAKSQQLAGLYRHLKDSLLDIGVQTYPYEPDDWIPHVTVASGRWSDAQARELVASVSPPKRDCFFLARALEVHRAQADGTWVDVAEVPLGRPHRSG